MEEPRNPFQPFFDYAAGKISRLHWFGPGHPVAIIAPCVIVSLPDVSPLGATHVAELGSF